MSTVKHRLLEMGQKASGLLGWLGVVGEGLLLVVLYIETVLDTPAGKTVILPDQKSEPLPPETSSAMSMHVPQWVLALVATVLLMALAYGLYRLVRRDIPEAKEKAEETVEKVAKKALKQIERRHTLTKKRERVLTARMVYWLKVGLVLVPLLVVVVFQNAPMSLSKNTAFFGMGVLALTALLWFTLERAFARLRVG